MSEFPSEASSHDARDAVLQRWSQTFRSQTASIARIAPSIASRHEAQRAWGYEIEGLARQVAVAKAQWNALALPCLLPTEILVNIFKFWKEIDPIVRRTIASGGGTLILHHGWLSATAVCQRFRAVALGHAAFWSTLNSVTPWELFVARSRDSPLCINMSGIGEPKYLPVILANLGRIRKLFLSYPSPHAAMEIFRRDAPQLQSLSVSDPWGHNDTSLHNFLVNHSPSLRTLRLSDVGIPSSIPLPLSLRYLKLRRCRAPSNCSFVELLSCLRNMPLLEEFISFDSLPQGGDMGSATVCLSHLRHLSLNEDDAGPLYLWSSLRASAVYHVELTLQTMEHGDMVHSDLITAIRGHLVQPWCPSYTTFILGHDHWEDGHVFSFIVQSVPVQTSDPEEVFDGSYHKLAITSYPEERDLEHPVVSLFPAKPVHTFVLREYILMSSSVMAQMLHPFIALGTIEATGSATVGKLLLSFVASHAAREEQTSAQHAYLPALHALSFKKVNFDSKVPEDARIPDISEGVSLHDLLKLALQLRASVAARIRTLTMQSCFTKSESWVQSCSVYVDALDWKNACGEQDVKTWEGYLDEEYD
ncbi:hypothetical protein PENSPDRAFT_732229 [Peniophora sp. CONT]|nr:hypothetical protein PENSPDRAFT_732229 [Peniophora sp. CONT]